MTRPIRKLGKRAIGDVPAPKRAKRTISQRNDQGGLFSAATDNVNDNDWQDDATSALVSQIA